MSGEAYDYRGELDREGRACGYGIAVRTNDSTWRYEGTFLDDKIEGLCKCSMCILN